jgi:hypothetical protein
LVLDTAVRKYLENDISEISFVFFESGEAEILLGFFESGEPEILFVFFESGEPEILFVFPIYKHAQKLILEYLPPKLYYFKLAYSHQCLPSPPIFIFRAQLIHFPPFPVNLSLLWNPKLFLLQNTHSTHLRNIYPTVSCVEHTF